MSDMSLAPELQNVIDAATTRVVNIRALAELLDSQYRAIDTAKTTYRQAVTRDNDLNNAAIAAADAQTEATNIILEQANTLGQTMFEVMIVAMVRGQIAYVMYAQWFFSMLIELSGLVREDCRACMTALTTAQNESVERQVVIERLFLDVKRSQEEYDETLERAQHLIGR